MESEQNYAYRKQKMKEEGLLEIPMAVDSARYFISNIRWADIVYTAPFLLLTIGILYLLYNSGNLNSRTVPIAFTPPVLVLLVFWVKHADRKNISLITTIKWRVKYKLSKKQYELTKERKKDMKDDIRSQLGIFNVANDCFETLDNHLVKVVSTTSVNLTGMAKKERVKSLSAYQSFLNNFPVNMFPLQIEQFSKPINLKSYLQWVEKKSVNEQDYVKRLLTESYINKANEIQKSKKMVSKARYIILREKIGSNKDKSLEKINNKAEILVSEISNMMKEKHKIYVEVLDNEQLFDLIYSAIDYENAQINQGQATVKKEYQSLFSSITLGRNSYESILEDIEKEKAGSIH